MIMSVDVSRIPLRWRHSQEESSLGVFERHREGSTIRLGPSVYGFSSMIPLVPWIIYDILEFADQWVCFHLRLDLATFMALFSLRFLRSGGNGQMSWKNYVRHLSLGWMIDKCNTVPPDSTVVHGENIVQRNIHKRGPAGEVGRRAIIIIDHN